MRDFGEAFTARQAGEVRHSQDLMSAARGVLGHAGIERVLALLKAGRIPYPDPPWWPTRAQGHRLSSWPSRRCRSG
jgi:hypothetical protein